MFYNGTAPPPATLATHAACPRCGLALMVLPRGEEVPAFHLALGEMVAYLQTAQDAIDAIRGTIEEAVQS